MPAGTPLEVGGATGYLHTHTTSPIVAVLVAALPASVTGQMLGLSDLIPGAMY
jgi:hypothetical protein